MNILFLDAYFEPEQIAFSHLEKDLISALVEPGHRIHVICPTPTRGISSDAAKAYKNRTSEVLYNGNVRVTRFAAPQEGKNPLIRALRYFWCNLRTYQIGAKQKDIDAVFADSTPPTQGWIAGKVAQKRKVPLVYSLQDIFPDSLVNARMTREGSFLWKIGRKIEDFTYKNADAIIVISESFKNNILAKGVPEDKIIVVPNWIDTDQIKPVPKLENRLFEEFRIDREKYTVVYAGNFGPTQGTDVMLEAASLLKEKENIQFVFFGGGAEFEAAKAYVEKNRLSNVTINELLPMDRVSEVYSLGDIALITCKPGVGNAGMPSKTWSIMACNTPIIASFDMDSELADILNRNNLGICVEPGNAEQLAEAIEGQAANPHLFSPGRIYVETHASKKACVSKYVETVENAVELKKNESSDD